MPDPNVLVATVATRHFSWRTGACRACTDWVILYPQLRIDFVAVKGTFGPELIERLSRRLGVPKNQMFIGTPGDRFPHRIEDLGGVRVIL